MIQNELQKQLPATLITLAILLLGAWYFFAETVETYPAYVHAWTQTDRLAIALNFQENGFDFFHPATFNLLAKDGITQVDFPIHDYLVACISSFLKVDIIKIFRGYNMVYSLVGLFFFFRLCLLTIKSPKRSVLATAFLFTLPFYVYYQNGFLPSAPSFANFLIAIYFLVKSKTLHSNKAYVWGVLFLSLSALARSPFFIFLFALFVEEIWQQWKKRKIIPLNILLPSLGVLSFVSYSLYNQHLAQTYGSMFLAELLNFNSFSNFIEVMGTAYGRWGKEIMSPYHTIILIALVLGVIIQIIRKGTSKNSTTSLVNYFTISSIGILIYFFAFGQQFADHDYYYLDTFLPSLALLLIILFARIRIPKKWYTTIATVCGIFFFYFFTYAKGIQEKRYTPPFNDRIEYAYSVYKNSNKDLKKWGVKSEDTIYVLEANTTNMPFTLWGNKGYTSLNSSEKFVKKELDSSFTYVALIDSFFVSSAFNDYPDLINRLDRVNGNGDLTLYKKNKDKDPSTFFENLIYYGYSDFDKEDNIADSVSAWTAEEILVDSMGKSLRIQPINLYTLSIKNKLSSVIPNKPIRIHILADYLQTDSSKVKIVCSINDYYQTQYTESHFKKMNQWMHQQFDFKISDSYFREGDELTLFYWNPEKTELYLDNLKILIYQ